MMTDHDSKMISEAAKRAPVWVYSKGDVRRAVLIAWCPRRPNGSHRMTIARVEYPTGTRATVKKEHVTLITEEITNG